MKIASFEEACEKEGLDPAAIIPDTSKMPAWLANKTEAGIKLDVIAKAMQDDRTFKKGEDRWFPVFKHVDPTDASGFGFSYSCTDDWLTNADVGARRELFSEEDSDHFAEHFIDLHRAEKCIILTKETSEDSADKE